MSLLRTRSSCALCGSTKQTVAMTLPATPPANEFVKEPGPQDTFPLTLQLCDQCGHLQLAEIVDPERLFRNYVYVSGTSPVFVKHFDDYAREVNARQRLGHKSLIVDIGSNDGTLLKSFKKIGFERVLGIDPAEAIASKATADGINTIPAFFDSHEALIIRSEYGPADVVTANNVFAHAEDLEEIARGVRNLLTPDGVFVFEVSYVADVIEKMLFDTIYHEHLSYHAVGPLAPFLNRCGLTLFHAQRVPTHGGSIRCFASRARREPTAQLSNIIQAELHDRLYEWHTYGRLKERIQQVGEKLRAKVKEWKDSGLKIAGYGAPAKLTTLMYAFGLDGADFEYIVDDSPWKQGLYTPGKNVCVMPSSHLQENPVDVCVVFAWNFFDSILEKNSGSGVNIWVNPLSL